jgi:hypothetical protein
MTERACTGPCGRTLPVDADHFHRRGAGFKTRCKDCAAAADADKAARREVADRERQAGERVKAAARAVFDRELDEAHEALDALFVELTGAPPLPVTFQTVEGRRNFIRNHIATAPGRAAEAADRARRIMAAARESADREAAPPDLGPLLAALTQQELGEVA